MIQITRRAFGATLAAGAAVAVLPRPAQALDLASAKAFCCPISTGPKPFRLGAGGQKSGRGSGRARLQNPTTRNTPLIHWQRADFPMAPSPLRD